MKKVYSSKNEYTRNSNNEKTETQTMYHNFQTRIMPTHNLLPASNKVLEHTCKVLMVMLMMVRREGIVHRPAEISSYTTGFGLPLPLYYSYPLVHFFSSSPSLSLIIKKVTLKKNTASGYYKTTLCCIKTSSSH